MARIALGIKCILGVSGRGHRIARQGDLRRRFCEFLWSAAGHRLRFEPSREGGQARLSLGDSYRPRTTL